MNILLPLARQICCRLFAEFPSFTQDRQMALLSMAFNLGAPRLAKFHNMRRAIARLILAVRGKSGRFGQRVKQGRDSAGLAGIGLIGNTV